MKYCSNCGKENNDDARFCLNCGAKFGEDNSNNCENILFACRACLPPRGAPAQNLK